MKSLILIFLFTLVASGTIQKKNAGSIPEFTGSIDLPGVKGRIDHLAYNPEKKIVYVAALGNNTVEVVDLTSRKVIHSIKGLDEPQGIKYISGTNSIFVSNGGNGVCNSFNTDTYNPNGSIKIGSDADNVRYSKKSERIYVGYGNGGIAIIDEGTLRLVADIKLEGHPESFQLDENAGKIFVNIPDVHQISVFDLNKNTIEKWQIKEASSNFPMALDTANHRIFVGCRNPAKLLVIDTESGNTITSLSIDRDTDDIFYDTVRKKIYISCGGGYLDIISQNGLDDYHLVSKIETRAGARTSLFIPELSQLIIAAPASSGDQARLMVYNIK